MRNKQSTIYTYTGVSKNRRNSQTWHHAFIFFLCGGGGRNHLKHHALAGVCGFGLDLDLNPGVSNLETPANHHALSLKKKRKKNEIPVPTKATKSFLCSKVSLGHPPHPTPPHPAHPTQAPGGDKRGFLQNNSRRTWPRRPGGVDSKERICLASSRLACGFFGGFSGWFFCVWLL